MIANVSDAGILRSRNLKRSNILGRSAASKAAKSLSASVAFFATSSKNSIFASNFKFGKRSNTLRVVKIRRTSASWQQ